MTPTNGPDDEIKRWKTAAEYWCGKYEAQRTTAAEVGRDQALYDEMVKEADDLRVALLRIKEWTLKQDDTVWFDTITTLHDFCDQALTGAGAIRTLKDEP